MMGLEDGSFPFGANCRIFRGELFNFRGVMIHILPTKTYNTTQHKNMKNLSTLDKVDPDQKKIGNISG